MVSFLTKEIIYYSLIPAFLAFVMIMIAYFANLKKKKQASLFWNYFVKSMVIVMICATLPLIMGFTFWIIERFSSNNTILEHMMYIILIIFLVLVLMALLIWVYLKTLLLTNNCVKTTIDE